MRIAFLHYRFTPNPDYVDLAQKLRERGHFVLFGSRNGSGDLSWHDGARVTAILPGQSRVPQPIKRIPLLPALWKRASYLNYLWRLRCFLREMQIDVVQVLPPPYFPWLFPLLMGGRIKCVLAIKQMNVGTGRGMRARLQDWLLSQSRALSARYFFAHTVFDYFLTAEAILGPDWSRWATAIPLGLNPRLFAIQSVNPPTVPEEKVRFLYVGTLSKFRQLERVIEAAAEAARLTDKFIIDIIGPDKTDGYYARLVQDLDAGHLVHIKPPVPYDTIPDLMATYHVGLAYTPDYLTWHYQPTIKILEYRAAGLPILSTDVAAHRHIVREGVTGLLVQDEVTALAEGIARLVCDRDFLRRCHESAQTNREGLTAVEVARRHEEVYRRILS